MADGQQPKPVQQDLPFKLKVKRASAGLGLFAAEPIPKGAFIIEYTGVQLSQAEYLVSNSSYLFEVGPKGALDGSPRWNKARYINHSCAPNCDFEIKKRRVFIFALRDIAAGEELGYDYGSDYFDELIGKRCRCIKCRAAGQQTPPSPT